MNENPLIHYAVSSGLFVRYLWFRLWSKKASIKVTPNLSLDRRGNALVVCFDKNVRVKVWKSNTCAALLSFDLQLRITKMPQLSGHLTSKFCSACSICRLWKTFFKDQNLLNYNWNYSFYVKCYLKGIVESKSLIWLMI